MCEEMKIMENEASETGAGRNKISRYKMREQAVEKLGLQKDAAIETA